VHLVGLSRIPVPEVCVDLVTLMTFSTWMDGGCEMSMTLLEVFKYSPDRPSDSSGM
jgi:hypothetical protein